MVSQIYSLSEAAKIFLNFYKHNVNCDKMSYILGWIDFFEKFLKIAYWSLDATYQILFNSFDVKPLHFSPEDFKNRMGIAENLQNENTRTINSVDLAYMQ
jgi:hypothetical protein